MRNLAESNEISGNATEEGGATFIGRRTEAPSIPSTGSSTTPRSITTRSALPGAKGVQPYSPGLTDAIGLPWVVVQI